LERLFTLRILQDRILSKDLWKSTGKTLAASVSTRLYSDIKKMGRIHLSYSMHPKLSASRHLGSPIRLPVMLKLRAIL